MGTIEEAWMEERKWTKERKVADNIGVRRGKKGEGKKDKI